MTKNSLFLSIVGAFILFGCVNSVSAQCGLPGTPPCPTTKTPPKPVPTRKTPPKPTAPKPTTPAAKPKPTVPKPSTPVKKPPTNVSKPKPKSQPQARFVARDPQIEMVKIPSGSFMMGSNNSQVDYAVLLCKNKYGSSCTRETFINETPQRNVTINYVFFIGKYEVTQAQWQLVMGNNPSKFSDCGGDCPVEEVSWEDVQNFIKKLNSIQSEWIYRLPSEAEWEYACRAGTSTAFSFGDLPTPNQANWDANMYKTTRVGLHKANNFGLYDMHGNVGEWVMDIESLNYKGLPSDGSPNMKIGDSDNRVARGGSWTTVYYASRSASRNIKYWQNTDSYLGFRLVARIR